MATYEDLQGEIYKDLMSHADNVKKWQSMAQADASGRASEIAKRSYETFSKFLIEDYIPHGCYNLSDDSCRPFSGTFRTAIEATGKILDECVGSSDAAVGRRRAVMKQASTDRTGEIGRSAKILNGIGRIGSAPLRNPFTPRIVEEFYDTMDKLKISSHDHFREDAVSAGLDIQPAPKVSASERSPSPAVPSPSNDRGSRDPVSPIGSPELSGRHQRAGTINPGSPGYWPRPSGTRESPIIISDSPVSADPGGPAGPSSESRQANPAPGSSPLRPSPIVVPETPVESPAASPSDFRTPPSAQPSKRPREQTAEPEHSSKRRQLDDRPEGRSPDRDL